MHEIGITLGALAGLVAIAGLTQAILGLVAVYRHSKRPAAPTGTHAPITILKPLHGDEPLLEEALASFCAQDYEVFQIVFGLQDAADPAQHVIRRLRARFPAVDIDVVIDPSQHGVNRKVSNLINMFPCAKHDTLVIADSDIHAPRDYLQQIAGELARPGVGLVTTLYAGLEASNTMAAQLGAAQINHSFLPGALMARSLGREDCLGATMALTRAMLQQIGGLQALVHHLADDAVLGRLVRDRGGAVALAATLPSTTVPEQRLADLFAHELRWGLTIQSMAPVGFPLSALQYPLFWAGITLCVTGLAAWAVALFATIWLLRASVMIGVNAALGLPLCVPFWLLPLRDCLSVTVIVATYGGREVAWRGHVLHISPPRLVPGKG